ncbi:uncharacterized protein [Porites lutea]|uniref:uncharacterized protein isoform X2 n=1 Tax=Porites lutea TaxID=51062 RepID=UPI003CC61223
MALQPYRDEDLNFFKFTSLVLNEFPNALRQAFKTMWDNTYGHRPGFQLWDDSTAVRNLFAATEGGGTKVPVHRSYHEWDCTALFQATIYSRAFAVHHGTLNDVYVKPRGLSHGHFHPSVVSTTGNNAETCALAIDQLRLLRNYVCHSTSSEMTKVTFDQYVKHAKFAFQALGVSTTPINAVGSLLESHFPINEVCKLEQGIKEENKSYIKFLEGVNSDIGELKKKLEGDITSKEDVAMLTQKIDVLKAMQDFADNREDITMSARRGGKDGLAREKQKTV